jgi:hypothetical protein
MDYSCPVALEFGAVGVLGFKIFPPARVAGSLRERRENSSFVRLHFFPRLPYLCHYHAND